MIKPSSPPLYSSTEPGHTEVLVPPPSDVEVQQSPSKSLHPNTPREFELQISLQNLEHQMISYQHHAREGRVTEQDVEGVAQAMYEIAHNHTDPKVKAEWKQNAKKFRKANPKGREGVLKRLLKGPLILLTLPFYVLGATLQATGAFLDGIGLAFKGAGRLSKKMAYTGGSSSKLTVPMDTTSNAP